MLSLPAVHNRQSPTFVFLGVTMKVLLSSEQTGGQFSLIEGVMPPGGDGGLHVHYHEDESMVLLEGQLEVTIGDKVFELFAGESYFAPRDVPQRLRNRGTIPARAMLVTTPGGFDNFIAKAGVPLSDAALSASLTPPEPHQLARLSELAEEFGIKILVPPEANGD